MFSYEFCEIFKNSFFIEPTGGCFWEKISIIRDQVKPEKQSSKFITYKKKLFWLEKISKIRLTIFKNQSFVSFMQCKVFLYIVKENTVKS